MNVLRKAAGIFASEGVAGLGTRSAGKIRRSVEAAAAQWRRSRAYAASVRLRVPGAPLALPATREPLVSIIVPVYGNDRYTYTCLHSITRHAADGVAFEVIVVDDGSPEESTQAMLGKIANLRVLRNERNEGYVAACNRGASAARGVYLLFLNNDTVVHHGWLAALVARIESDPAIGAAGAMTLYPDGSVCEAGAIVWNDGSAWNYGRSRRSRDAALRYVRDVDYCSGAALIVRRDAFVRAGGFDERYRPGYYEDVDLCFTLRALGLRTVFEPQSVVTHVEGATAGTSPARGAKRYQAINRDRFTEKWSDVLTAHQPPGAIEEAARRLSGSPRVLVIDSFVPFTDRDAGSIRIAAIMAILRDIHAHVMFLPDDGHSHEPYAQQLRALGIEVLEGRPLDVLARYAPLVEIAWVCRYELAAKYVPELRRHGVERIVYDTVDLHFLRLRRQEFMTMKKTDWESVFRAETELARNASVTVVTSPVEAGVLAELGVHNVAVVPVIFAPVQGETSWADRHGLLFVGNYTHAPNVDAAIHLCSTILPLIESRLPGVELVLAGNDPPPEIVALASARVHVTGRVPNMRPYLRRARLLVAPLRFGAGVKGKIVEAMAHGLPVVTTEIGAEGIDGASLVVCNDACAFANASVELYSDPSAWERMARAGRSAAERYSPECVRRDVKVALEKLVCPTNYV